MTVNNCLHVQECILSECRVCGPEQRQGVCTYGCAPRVTLVRAVQTGFACPSQWDAWDADGGYYYLRYRWGHGTASSERSDSLVAEFDTGDSLGGVIDLDEFCQRAGIRLELSDG